MSPVTQGLEALIRPDLRAGVPLVDGVVVLHAGIGAAPGGEGDLVPQIAGLDGLGDFAVGAAGEVPVAVFFDGLEEAVGDADGIVGILPADGHVGFAVEIVIELQAELGGQFLLVLGQMLHPFGHGGDFQFLADFPVDERLRCRGDRDRGRPSWRPGGWCRRT